MGSVDDDSINNIWYTLGAISPDGKKQKAKKENQYISFESGVSTFLS